MPEDLQHAVRDERPSPGDGPHPEGDQVAVSDGLPKAGARPGHVAEPGVRADAQDPALHAVRRVLQVAAHADRPHDADPALHQDRQLGPRAPLTQVFSVLREGAGPRVHIQVQGVP